jgi:hypothetical protein
MELSKLQVSELLSKTDAVMRDLLRMQRAGIETSTTQETLQGIIDIIEDQIQEEL